MNAGHITGERSGPTDQWADGLPEQIQDAFRDAERVGHCIKSKEEAIAFVRTSPLHNLGPEQLVDQFYEWAGLPSAREQRELKCCGLSIDPEKRVKLAEWTANNRWSDTLPIVMRAWFRDVGVASIEDAIRIVSDTMKKDIPYGVGTASLRKLNALAGLPLASNRSIARAIALLKKNGYAVHVKREKKPQ